jgi:hypothetical protein
MAGRTATLTVHDVDHRRSKRLIIDCQHGTTTAVFKPHPDNAVTEEELVADMVRRHSARERCRCAQTLIRPETAG